MRAPHSVVILAFAVVGLVALGAGCRDGDGPPTATATVTVVPTTTATIAATAAPTPSIEDEVLAAYARYWDVYADALLRLDSTRLSEVMTGPRLERAVEEIRALEAQGQAVRIIVQTDPLVATVAGDEARVVDEYVNSSYLIDAISKEAVGDREEPNTLRDTFSLVRENGSWRVRDSLRQAETP